MTGISKPTARPFVIPCPPCSGPACPELRPRGSAWSWAGAVGFVLISPLLALAGLAGVHWRRRDDLAGLYGEVLRKVAKTGAVIAGTACALALVVAYWHTALFLALLVFVLYRTGWLGRR